jgi:hypothetical protein
MQSQRNAHKVTHRHTHLAVTIVTNSCERDLQKFSLQATSHVGVRKSEVAFIRHVIIKWDGVICILRFFGGVGFRWRVGACARIGAHNMRSCMRMRADARTSNEHQKSVH